MRYDDFLQSAAGGEGTDLGGVLRQPDVRKVAASCEYVESVFQLERHYLGAHGQTQMGHEFRIDMVDSLDQGSHAQRQLLLPSLGKRRPSLLCRRH